MGSDSKLGADNLAASFDTLRRAKIQRPTTIHDKGDPTDDCLFDAKRVFRLIEDERYLSAETLHQSIRDRIQKEIDDGANFNIASRISEKQKSHTTRKRTSFKRQKNTNSALDERKLMALQLLNENEIILKKMKDRCCLFKKAKKNLDVNDDWTKAQTLFGVTTYYRKECDGSMSIKLEGCVNDCSLFDQVAVIRELDLNYLWAPFVTSSMTIVQLDKLDLIGWFLVGLPHFGLIRDALFRAIGCDSIYEDGSVLIFAQSIGDRPRGDQNSEDTNTDQKMTTSFDKSIKSVDASNIGRVGFDDEYNQIVERLRKDPILDTLDLPPIPTRMGSGRLTIRSFAAQIHLESPTSAITKLVANIDPNMHLIPQPLIDYVMKRMFGTILYKMKCAAKNISANPITNLHAIKIREEKDFYKTFLLPKFEGVCKIRGWQMPSISAFELSDAQLEMAEVCKARGKKKSEMKALKVFNSNNADNNLDEYLQSSISRSISDGEVVDDSDQTMEDEPKVRTMYRDLDDLSDISRFSTSSSFWRSNPVSNFRRQIEEKTQIRKNREIRESRERAAARLKPKSLNEDALLRLKELRDARSRRKPENSLEVVKENGYVTPSGVDKNVHRWNISLSNHGFLTKIFVLQFLMVSLFCLLYLDTAFNKVIAVREGAFEIERGRDIATLIYIIVAGLVHSIFCYIALIYAFTALQIGSISGRRTRHFYSQYVHYAVAITSGSMVGFGVIKPGVDKALRWVVWNTYSIFKVSKIALLGKIPDRVAMALQILVNAIITVLSSTQKLFLESNILGHCIISVTQFWLVTIVKTMSYPFVTYAKNAVKQYEGDLDALSWREDTFFTTRALLSHSAFFLLVLLFLFNFTAKQARNAIYGQDNAEISSLNEAYRGNLKGKKNSEKGF